MSAAAKALLNSLSAAPTQAAQDVPMAYWGDIPLEQPKTPDGSYDWHSIAGKSAKDKVKPKYITADEAVADFYNWSDSQRKAFGERMHSIGLLEDPSNFMGALDLWKQAVSGSVISTMTGKDRSPWQVLDLWDGLTHDADRKKPPPPPQVNYNIPSAQEAEAAIKQIFRDKVGRDPNDSELSKYRGMLIRKAKESPSISTTKYDTNGYPTGTTTTGGFDATGFIGDTVENNDDYGVYQASTVYYNAFKSALGAPA